MTGRFILENNLIGIQWLIKGTELIATFDGRNDADFVL